MDRVDRTLLARNVRKLQALPAMRLKLEILVLASAAKALVVAVAEDAAQVHLHAENQVRCQQCLDSLERQSHVDKKAGAGCKVQRIAGRSL